MPALLAYNGQAYKHLRAGTLSDEALEYAQKHLWITCFLYGLLRPMDSIVPYRMEHCVTLEATNDKPINQFWKDRLTDMLIDSVKTVWILQRPRRSTNRTVRKVKKHHF